MQMPTSPKHQKQMPYHNNIDASKHDLNENDSNSNDTNKNDVNGN